MARATITLNGLAYRDGKKQVIARVLETKYHYHRGYYYVAIEKKILQSMDNFTYSDARRFCWVRKTLLCFKNCQIE
ncbi:hypothetical protein J4732_05545 [Serratia marcescens]|uniref:Uncharacterized protein n=1 Tax=Serratia marcescens TaxID=615 RepID=A0A939STC9_SERMA|nr:hypothetical protein [Serratia marcescens]